MIFDPIYMAIFVGGMIASKLVGMMLQKRFSQYSAMPINLSGKEIAEKMLHENGINDVKVISVGGMLTDHYNPQNKTVNLSEVVYNERNVAAAAVAAHECGHAVQHAKSYAFLSFRSAMVPMLTLTSNFTSWVLMGGIILMGASGNKTVLLIGVLMLAASTLFSLITLPVEFDASKRALAWLNNSNVVGAQQHDSATNALWWAAMTYVVAALASLATLLYYASMLLGRRND